MCAVAREFKAINLPYDFMDIFCGNMFYDFMWTLESKKEIVQFCHELLQNFCITRVFLFAKIWNTVELSSNIFCMIFYSISCLP